MFRAAVKVRVPDKLTARASDHGRRLAAGSSYDSLDSALSGFNLHDSHHSKNNHTCAVSQTPSLTHRRSVTHLCRVNPNPRTSPLHNNHKASLRLSEAPARRRHLNTIGENFLREGKENQGQTIERETQKNGDTLAQRANSLSQAHSEFNSLEGVAQQSEGEVTLSTAPPLPPATQIQNSRSENSTPRPHSTLRLFSTTTSSQTLSSSSSSSSMPSDDVTSTPPSKTSPAAQHKPLVVGRTKPQPATPTPAMDSSSSSATVPADVKAAVNHEIADNVESNTASAAPAAGAKPKKEKAPKQPKAPKAPATPPAPVSPALIDLRVGHILRAIAHPNADSLYVSTIAMGDAEGTEHTSVDEETGKIVRTVCSGLNGLVPLAEMQDRKVIVVANLKPVNMRSIKSAAMVLAASPPAEEGADPHAADRVVELVIPPEGAEAGDPVFFEGWPYGEGKGPEKQLNPKKKVWESVQPGFFTSEDLVVGFDAGRPGVEIEGEKEKKGWLVVEGKGQCTVKTLKGAVVR